MRKVELNQRCSMSKSMSPPITSLMRWRYLSGSWRLRGSGGGTHRGRWLVAADRSAAAVGTGAPASHPPCTPAHSRAPRLSSSSVLMV